MRQFLPLHFPVCLLAGLTFGCSGDDSGDSSTQTPAREVVETRRSAADGTSSSLASGSEVRDAADRRPALPPTDLASDADEPRATNAEPNAQSLAMAIPFSSASIEPPADAAANRRGRGDEDDPDAPVIAAKPELESEAAPRINNGRGGQLVPSSKQVPSPSTTELAADDDSSSPPDPLPGQPGEEAPNETADAASQENAGTDRQPATAGPISANGSSAAATDAGAPQLAAQYAPLDKDGDGQIGLYEWPRDKLADFQKLDANQDGFLTPEELVDLIQR